MFADTLTESGDAGDLPPSAQVAAGINPLTEISGAISAADEDMYKICLEGNGSFSASTVGTATFDTQLFLFDSAGFGVYHNDDHPGGPPFHSLLPASDPLTPVAAGIYYLAVSKFDNDPLSVGNLEIFPGDLSGPEGPTGPGGGSPIIGWNDDSGAAGTYTIHLTGAFEVDGRPCAAPVGGTTSFLIGGSESSAGSIALLAGGVAATLAIAAAGGWYTRRRWLRS